MSPSLLLVLTSMKASLQPLVRFVMGEEVTPRVIAVAASWGVESALEDAQFRPVYVL